jgi:dTDP-4-amino-4,6-dideoxygalactose transaminase
MNIPYLDLQKLQQRFQSQDQVLFADFLKDGPYIGGDRVTDFETAFADFCGVHHAIATGNGLDALTVILKADVALGKLPTQARILVPAHTYIATFLSIHNAGLTPVPVDVEVLNLSVAAIKNSSEPADAIIGVDIYGKLVGDEVYAFAKAEQINIYTDTAQSHGARNASGKRSGSLARASAFSFYPTKNLGALGDAGAITTNDEELAVMCRKIANYGRDSRFINGVKGINSRLDPLQASLLLPRLKQLDGDNESRVKIASYYYRHINNDRVILLPLDFLDHNAMHVFPVFVEDRIRFERYMSDHGIGTSCHYEKPPHLQKAFHEFNHLKFPVAEQLHRTEVSIPCNPLITMDQAEFIVKTINAYS